MSPEEIIEKTSNADNPLSQNERDVNDLIANNIKDRDLNSKIVHIITHSGTFDFLSKEEDLYTLADLKEIC